jgi:hypothetical protein
MTEETKPFVVTPELQTALDNAVAVIKNRPSGKRHPFGRMINCQVCHRRHREVGETTFVERRDPVGKKTTTVEQVTTKCVQKFTNTVNGFELLKEVEDADGNKSLVPDLRTFGTDGERPTLKQIMGSKSVAGKRIKAHPSKMKLLFIMKTREAFTDLGFDVDCDKETFSKNLQIARQEAARRIRADHKARKTARRSRSEHSRRINAGLANPGTRWYSHDRVGA